MGNRRRLKTGNEGHLGKTYNMPCLRPEEARELHLQRCWPALPPGGSELPPNLSPGDIDIPHPEKAHTLD